MTAHRHVQLYLHWLDSHRCSLVSLRAALPIPAKQRPQIAPLAVGFVVASAIKEYLCELREAMASPLKGVMTTPLKDVIKEQLEKNEAMTGEQR